MKIAMLGHKRIPSREGGIEIVVEEISTRLAALGHDVYVYNRKGNYVHGSGDYCKKIKEYKGVKIIHIPTVTVKGLDALVYSFFAVVRALFGRYDVIHFHAEGPGVMILITRLLKIKSVATVHGLDWQRAKWGNLARKYIRYGEKVIASRADEVIVLSSNNQKYFSDKYSRKTNFIPNGVSKPNIRKASLITEKYGLHGHDYLLFLSRLVPEKGLDYLIDAFKPIKTDIRMVIAGGSSHSNDYEVIIKRKAENDSRIIFTGFVEGELLEELFSNCTAYILPSDIEGMPLSLLEAMSYGCSCLVSNIPENTEVAGDFALAFKKADTADLQEKLECILNRGLNAHTPDEISAYILKKYNWDKIVDSHLMVYNNNNDIEAVYSG
jgi:glycosyltransferase involved in cell wall biosynthesis